MPPNDIITYTKKIPVIKGVFGVSLLIFGAIIFLAGIWLMGLISIAFGLNLISTEGSQINFITKQYRSIKSIAGIHIGRWKACPEFDYVSVFRTQENQTINVVTATTTITNSVILLNLFYCGNRHITFYKTNNKSDEFKVAKHFALVFTIDILDSTEREKQWL
jgi:hypothetical protein